MNSPQLKQWLETARQWPAQAPEWDEIEQFALSLQELSAEKQRERQGATQLAQALDDLHQAHSPDDLQVFEASNCLNWDATRCALDQAEALAERVARFDGDLKAHRELDELPRLERRQQRKQLDELDNRILQSFSDLDTILGAPSPHPNNPSLSSNAIAATAPAPAPAPSKTAAKTPKKTRASAAKSAQNEPTSNEPTSKASTPTQNEDSKQRAPKVAPLDEPSDAFSPFQPPAKAQAETPDNPPFFARPAAPMQPPRGWPTTSQPRAATTTENLTSQNPTSQNSAPTSQNEPDVEAKTDPDREEMVPSPSGLGEPNETAETKQSATMVADETPNALSSEGDVGQSPLAIDRAKGSERTISARDTEICASESDASLAGEPTEHWHALLWQLLEADDVMGAYWLARELERMGAAPIPSQVLGAVQGARWSRGDEDLLAGGLRRMVEATPTEAGPTAMATPDVELAQGILQLAAALSPTLRAPTSGLRAWLSVPATQERSLAALAPLVSAVGAFADRNIALRSSDLHQIADRDQRDTQFAQLAAQARVLLDKVATGRTQHQRSSVVLRDLGAHDLRDLLTPIIGDERESVDRVQAQASEWQDNGFLVARIQEIDRAHNSIRNGPIVGNSLGRLVRELSEGRDMAQEWCALIQEETRRDDFITREVAKLRESVRGALPQARELLADSQTPPLRAACACLSRALDLLSAELLGDATVAPPRWARPRAARTLGDALAYRLLPLPQIPVERDEFDCLKPRETAWGHIAPALQNSIDTAAPFLRARQGRVAMQDYRFADELAEMATWPVLRATDADDAEPETQSQQESTFEQTRAEDDSRKRLDGAKFDAEDAITRALVDGIIGEDSALRARLANLDSNVIEEFAPALEAVAELNAELQNERKQRNQMQGRQWDELRQSAEFGRLRDADRARIERVMTERLRQADTRVADELLSDLRSSLEGDQPLSSLWDDATDTPRRDFLREFRERFSPMREWLDTRQQRGQTLDSVIADVREKRSKAGFAFGALPDKRVREAVAGLEAWQSLKKGSPRTPDSELLNALSVTLGQFLGFTLNGTPSEALHIKERGREFLYLEARMSGGGFSPVPQFGSAEEGRYAVLCLWGRPAPDSIEGRVRDLHLSERNVIALYLGQMSEAERRSLGAVCRAEKLALALLDEMLLLFLCGEREARLPAFWGCALPLTAINPYTPFGAGNVPHEMFFGRRDEVRKLRDPNGPCLVYGGRQLGKSALLRQVARQSHAPAEQGFAWVEDIKNIGDPLGRLDTNEIWRRLREKCKEFGLLHPNVSADKPEQILEHIRKAVMAAPTRRVLALFDEADNFLDADAQNNFRIVSDLRRLMDETGRRFKVVFAGLHNVYRFQTIPNQPLVHFGAPICVGPLDARDAQELVTRPLEALGYRFETEGDGAARCDGSSRVLRVLSYTNSHSGLLQLFCQELLNRLHRARREEPPYCVDAAEVEDTYRAVRDAVQTRFEWTLALDKRYQAIAWRLIFEGLDESAQALRSYSVREIREIAREAWPKGFVGAEDAEIYALLEEMCGLGVLARGGDKSYRLRSPNLIRLVGTADEVVNRLDELERQEPELPLVPESHHVLLDEKARRFSPFTHAQVEGLAPPEWGVGLIFASPALGAAALPDALRALVPAATPAARARCQAMPATQNPAEVKRYLDEFFAANTDKAAMVLWRAASADASQIVACVRAALEVCAKRAARDRWGRVFFVFDERATWNYLALSPTERRLLEETVGSASIVTPRPWNELGIAQRLKQGELLDNQEVRRAILQATGGWPFLLDELFGLGQSGLDPGEAARQINRDIAPDSELGRRFRASLGFEGQEGAARVLRCIQGLGEAGLPTEDVAMLPDLIEGAPLDEAQCRHAIEFLHRLWCVRSHLDQIRVDPLVARVLVR